MKTFWNGFLGAAAMLAVVAVVWAICAVIYDSGRFSFALDCVRAATTKEESNKCMSLWSAKR